MRIHWVTIGCLILGTRITSGDPQVDFVRDIEPIFREYCHTCHGPEEAEAGLRLDSRRVAFRGGDSGDPAIVPHAPDASRLIQLVTAPADRRMPPEESGGGLSPKQIARLREWIRQGADWPDAAAGFDPDAEALKHWSFQPVVRPKLPSVDHAWLRGPIDAFVLDRLRAEGLIPSPAADRATFARRVFLDLLGVPPTPVEADRFIRDTSVDAVDRLVDRVLSDSRYGERWGQHWLDVVRYADTHGFEVNTPRPNAWPYRDYVISALNRDLPYDQFVREQLIGDQLGVDPATGFLVTAAALLPGQIGKDEASKLQARQDELDELLIGVGGSLLGLTIGCARCHHHKFDPITQHDYYAMQAVFAGVRYGERAWRSQAGLEELARLKAAVEALDLELQQHGYRTAVNAARNEERFAPIEAKYVRFTALETNRLEPCLDELEIYAASDTESPGVNVALRSSGALSTESGDKPITSDRHKLEHINDGQYGNSRSWLASQTAGAWVQIELPSPIRIDRIVWGRDREGQFRDRLAVEYVIETALRPDAWRVVASSGSRLPTHVAASRTAAAVLNERGVTGMLPATSEHVDKLLRDRQVRIRRLDELTGKSRNVFAGLFGGPERIQRLARGDIRQPRETSLPNVVNVLGRLELDESAGDVQRRLAFADWVVAAGNPLTARVMVNRIWHYHFGTGIVDTPNDFGNSGGKPSHPRLLDWLADEFTRHGWSLKHLHRLILTSSTYGQSAVFNSRAAAVDANNRWLWRFPTRRLEAETIRDTLLSVTGELNPQGGGPGFDLFKSRGGLSGFPPVEQFEAKGLRRMIYAHKIRMEPDPVFGAFDCPDAGQSCPKRTRSTTAIQALNLFNSPFIQRRAAELARRIEARAGSAPADQIQEAFEITLGRGPQVDELVASQQLVEQYSLNTLCRVLVNTNEFLFLP